MLVILGSPTGDGPVRLVNSEMVAWAEGPIKGDGPGVIHFIGGGPHLGLKPDEWTAFRSALRMEADALAAGTPHG
jgi:hypothetical protein